MSAPSRAPASEAAARDRSLAGASSLLRWLPSPVAIIAFALGGVMFAVTVAKGVQDPDYFWHVTAGRLIVETGRVPSTDPFSFTWFGQPWTPHEWLSEVLIYLLTSTVGRIGALLAFGLFPVAIFGVMAAALARQGARALAIALPFVLGAYVLIGYVTLRPQAVSWLLIAVLVWFLLELRADRPRRVLWLLPFFVLWANLHGVYVIGLGVLGIYMVFTLAGRTAMSPVRGWVLGATVGAVLAAMVTPAGPIGILYPLRYVDAGDWGLANIAEWQSPNFHEPAHLGFLVLIAAIGLNGGRNTPGWLVALSWIGVALGLLALRNAPIAVVLGVPALVLGLEARLRDRDARRSPRRIGPSRALGRRLLELIAAVVIVIGAGAVVIPRDLNTAIDQNLARRFPVAAMDRLLQIAPSSNLLAEYGWGGYAISLMYPHGGHVFVDGRNDMYSQQVLEDYSSIRAADPGWQGLVARYGVEAILLPPDATLTRGPALDAGWCEAYRDDVAVLLLPDCSG